MADDAPDDAQVSEMGPSAFSRDDSRYWSDRPSDHGPDGLYAFGPHPARPGWTRWTKSDAAPASVPSPSAARGRMELEQRRARRALREAAEVRARATAGLPPKPTGVRRLLAALQGRALR